MLIILHTHTYTQTDGTHPSSHLSPSLLPSLALDRRTDENKDIAEASPTPPCDSFPAFFFLSFWVIFQTPPSSHSHTSAEYTNDRARKYAVGKWEQQ